jgi:hypothetical protein
MKPEDSFSPPTLIRQRPRRWLHGVVSCLRGITVLIRMGVTLQFAALAALDFLFRQWGDFCWHLTIAIAVSPAWDKDS